ncbi:thioredoxin domain-containing protein [Shewanella japonica]|uniref:thioredoxin domain-containing protein n=1 Tax=Shewanella japonica TaxID=93973 RepID=UPI0024947EE1|nr:DUF255 domain-containing protein [Shewanella japonica]
MIYRLFVIAIVVLHCFGVLYSQKVKADDSSLDNGLLSTYKARKPWFVNQGIVEANSTPKYLNQLINSDSPYLLSHALQPINWKAWSPSFEKGIDDSTKLIFVSIGYSTCHWCHVMAEESFLSSSIANVLNKSYLSIKVDREQWPLVDNRFKTALETLKGEAGWPINVVLTPGGDVIWVDSYLQAEDFKKVLVGLAKRWQQKPQAILSVSERIKRKLNENIYSGDIAKQNLASSSEVKKVLPEQHKHILSLMKSESVQSGPRFLRANWSLGQLDEYLRTGKREYLDSVESQVRGILMSPTYDAIEGGFHRYAVDGNWQQPHYEKMLYTQANMIRVLSKLYAITSNSEYLTALNQTNSWVKKWLKQPFGYASAVSALSDGKEGAYYQLPNGLIPLDNKAKTYLNYTPTKQEVLGYSLLSLTSLTTNWPTSAFVAQVQSYRDIAAKPLIDEKVLVSWNALYAIALLEAYSVTNDKQLQIQANRLINNLWDNFYLDGTLFRSGFLGKVSVEGQYDDYALLASALLRLSFYESWSDIERASSSKSRAKLLLQHLQISLSQAYNFNKLMSLNHDGELSSIKSSVYEAFVEGYKLVHEPSFNKLTKSIASFDKRNLHLLVNEYSLSNQLSAKQRKINIGQTYFAKGHGKILVTYEKDAILVNVDLEPGWHINADSVMDERYLPTQLSIRNLTELNSAQIEVTYPKAKLQSLSFSKKPLKLFEGDFIIQMDISSLKVMDDPMIIINLQSCSDRLCLLPETLYIVAI